MQCPNCSKEIRDTAKVCGYCGHRLQLAPAKCPECGNDRREGAKVCGYCGHKFVTTSQTSEIKAEPTRPPGLDFKENSEPSQEPINASIPDLEPAPADRVEPTPQPESKETLPPAQEPEPEPTPIKAADVQVESKPKPSPKHIEQPKQVKETKEKVTPAPKPKIAKSQPKLDTRKKFPGWLWAVVGLIVLGSVAAIVFFAPNMQLFQSLPTPVTEIFPNARIVLNENFDDGSINSFDMHNVTISAGQATLIGNGEILSSQLIYDPEIGVGEGTLALFMIDPEFEDEQWWLLQLYTRRNGEYFGSVGFSEWYHPYYDIEQEEGGESVFRGIRTSPKTGVWYYALFAITDEDKIVVRIWERDAPSNLSEYTWRLDYRLIGRSWRSAMFSHNGKMYIDSFTVISFSE